MKTHLKQSGPYVKTQMKVFSSDNRGLVRKNDSGSRRHGGGSGEPRLRNVPPPKSMMNFEVIADYFRVESQWLRPKRGLRAFPDCEAACGAADGVGAGAEVGGVAPIGIGALADGAVDGEVFGAEASGGAPEAFGEGFGSIIRFAFCSSVKLLAGCLCMPVVIRYASGVPDTGVVHKLPKHKAVPRPVPSGITPSVGCRNPVLSKFCTEHTPCCATHPPWRTTAFLNAP